MCVSSDIHPELRGNNPAHACLHRGIKESGLCAVIRKQGEQDGVAAERGNERGVLGIGCDVSDGEARV